MGYPVNSLRMRNAAIRDPYFANVSLLCGFNGTDGSTSLLDESSYARTLTPNGNAQIDTAQAKFGVSALLMDGSGDFVTAADAPELDFGTGEFTLDLFIRFNGSVPASAAFLSKFTASSVTSSFLFGKSGTSLTLNWYSAGGNFRSVNGVGSWAADTWYLLSADRAVDTFRVYQDGAVLGSGTHASENMNDSSGVLQLGQYFSGSPQHWNGWMDEVRMTKGVGRHRGAFTPPTSAFPRS